MTSSKLRHPKRHRLPSIQLQWDLRQLLDGLKRRGDRVAVWDRHNSLTYADLNQRVIKISRWLENNGVRPGTRVGLHLAKSADAVAALLALLTVGAVFVPLNVAQSAVQKLDIIRDCQLRWVIHSPDSPLEDRSRAARTPSFTPLLLSWEKLWRVCGYPSYQTPGRQEAAAIFHTSGSTGRTKGAVLTRDNIQAFVRWAVRKFRITQRDRLISHAPLHVEMMLFDLFAGLAAGAQIVLVPDEKSSDPDYLTDLIIGQKVTIWHSVPLPLILMAEYGCPARDPIHSLRHVLFAGDRMPAKYIAKFRQCFQRARLYNVYGATKTYDSFLYEITADAVSEPFPISCSLSHACQLTAKSICKTASEKINKNILRHQLAQEVC
jgi:non-ribosomal peptide synthetase component F